MRTFIDLSNQRFGKLTAKSHRKGERQTEWFCVCDCGKETIVTNGCLRSGHTQSCGCARHINNRGNLKHGHSPKHGKFSKTYIAWMGMIQRCRSSSHPSYDRYGGRGIIVCDRWHKFENFYADMGDPPTAKHSIDRKDNDGNYELSNCRWATRIEQENNKSTNRVIEWRGRRKTLTEWSRVLNMKKITLHARVVQLGWGIDRAFTTPVRSKNKC